MSAADGPAPLTMWWSLRTKVLTKIYIYFHLVIFCFFPLFYRLTFLSLHVSSINSLQGVQQSFGTYTLAMDGYNTTMDYAPCAPLQRLALLPLPRSPHLLPPCSLLALPRRWRVYKSMEEPRILFLFFILSSYTTLFCFVLFCFVLFCFVLFCFVLFCFVLFCFVLFCFVLFCSVLFDLILFYFILFYFI